MSSKDFSSNENSIDTSNKKVRIVIMVELLFSLSIIASNFEASLSVENLPPALPSSYPNLNALTKETQVRTIKTPNNI